MPDILVRHIDDTLAERIKEIARERKWSINDVILHALRHGVGLGGEELVRRDTQDIANLRGTWDQRETAAFTEALDAFKQIESASLVEAAKKQQR